LSVVSRNTVFIVERDVGTATVTATPTWGAAGRMDVQVQVTALDDQIAVRINCEVVLAVNRRLQQHGRAARTRQHLDVLFDVS
jgi:hypothetical protein